MSWDVDRGIRAKWLSLNVRPLKTRQVIRGRAAHSHRVLAGPRMGHENCLREPVEFTGRHAVAYRILILREG